MTDNNIAIGSLAMDLKRVALAYHNRSDKTAEIFIKESLKRNSEVDTTKTPDHINKILINLPIYFELEDKQNLAEKALTYSVILQNYTTAG